MENTTQKEKTTTIKVSISTRVSLDLMKIHPRQSYDEVIINKILEKDKTKDSPGEVRNKFGSRKE